MKLPAIFLSTTLTSRKCWKLSSLLINVYYKTVNTRSSVLKKVHVADVHSSTAKILMYSSKSLLLTPVVLENN